MLYSCTYSGCICVVLNIMVVSICNSRILVSSFSHMTVM